MAGNGFIALVVALIAYIYAARIPKFAYVPKDLGNLSFEKCSKDKSILIFGGTSLLGRYITKEVSNEFPDYCVVNYNRRPAKNVDISVIGDARDTRFVNETIKNYKPEIIFLSIKPDLEGTNFKEFVEVNFLALKEVTDIAKSVGVKKLIHVSSIAVSNHYENHYLVDESYPLPLLTDYRSGYDLSKRLIEDYILAQNTKSFQTVALRVSGIIGGAGDPFLHHRLPGVAITFNHPVILDYGFAGNIAGALVCMAKELNEKSAGEVYYFTGEHLLEKEAGTALSEITGKYLLEIPLWMMRESFKIWDYIRPNYHVYSFFDLMHLADYQQTFKNDKFFKTFSYRSKLTIKEALRELYG